MFVKICGITNRDDAFAAIDAGAAAIGFVFYKPSPRYASPESIAPWIGQIPAPVWKAGVFVNESPATIEEIATNLKLDIAQLHGDETPDRFPRLPRIWKAHRVESALNPAWDPDAAEAILLDGLGQGATFDWALAKQVPGRVIVAGGLTAENVGIAVQQANPWGVDVASGVEAAPGRKDHARMRTFIKAALSS